MYPGERFNSISHLVGALLAMAGAAVLITLAARLGDPWKVVAFSIYGAMMVALYAASTAYHSVRRRTIKAVLQKLDHCSIYLLIAGSYTPFALVSLRGAWGWSLLGVVWGLALLGIAQEIWWARGARVLSLVIYVLMGWLALVAVVPLWQALTPAGFAWLLAGRGLLHAGRRFLCAGPPRAPRPWAVAPVCAGRQRLPLLHRFFLRGLRARLLPMAAFPSSPSPAANPRLVPPPVGALLARLPAYPGSMLLVTALNLALARHLPVDVGQVLLHKKMRVQVRDARVAFDFAWTGQRFAPHAPLVPPQVADVTLNATAHDFFAAGPAPARPGHAVFSRRLSMEGDTELGLVVKNALDAIELPVLDPRQWVHRLAPRQVLGHLRRRLDPTPRNGG